MAKATITKAELQRQVVLTRRLIAQKKYPAPTVEPIKRKAQ